MRTIIGRHWPLVLSVVVLGVTTAILIVSIIQHNQGHFGYALDDVYIHLSMARNLSEHGVWGISPSHFTSSASSLLWILILSAVNLILGSHELTPLILDILLATALLAMIYSILRRHNIDQAYSFCILMAVTFLTPLPAMIFGGMEHILQTLLYILFCYRATKLLQEPVEGRAAYDLRLLAIAPFVPLIRYEGLFLVAVICTLFLIRKRVGFAFLLGAIAVTPITIFGLISVAHGWPFLPVSVLLKGNPNSPTSIDGIVRFFHHAKVMIAAAPHLQAFGVAALALYFVRRRRGNGFWESGQQLLLIFLLTTALHMIFAQLGAFYRYESYLVALGLFTFALTIPNPLGLFDALPMQASKFLKYSLALITISIILAPSLPRAYTSLWTTPVASENIFEEQYQWGLFLKKFYENQSVAVNDIGATVYVGHIEPTDLYGLATVEVARAKKNRTYDTATIDSLTRKNHVRIAIVYDLWLLEFGGAPRSWRRVGTWQIKNNVVEADDRVSFYAVDPSEEAALRANMTEYLSQLPNTVTPVFDHY